MFNGVWISDEKLLIFASLISPYSAARRIFNSLLGVSSVVMKHCISCLIYYMKHGED